MLPCRYQLEVVFCFFLSGFLQAEDSIIDDIGVVNNIALFKSTPSAFIDNGIINVKAKETFTINLFGLNLDLMMLSFTEVKKKKGENCDDDRFTYPIRLYSTDNKIVSLSQRFEMTSKTTLYLCLKARSVNDTKVKNVTQSAWVHQGSDDFLKIEVLQPSWDLPLWLKATLLTILMMLSAMFSGLNLGLMSFDLNELKIISTSSSIQNQKYAKKIIPVRRHGNFLLCTLLLGNTLVNSTFTIILDSVTSGIVAVVGSTLGIVLLGEIIPQSICSRYGLAVGAYTIYLTKLFMIITFPVSYPISKILDRILGKELGNVYNKQQLLEMLKLQHEYDDLEQDEVGIISGALKYREKKVCQVMTALEDCFMLDEEAVLDFKTMSSIIRSGYSRIPIFSTQRSNIVAILFVKDLAFVDPDDCIPLLTVIKFYNHPVHKVFDDTTLDKILEEFKKGTTHISIVMRIKDDGERDPFYECIGIVTLEDIIEEIIQAEIVDETDVYVDNVSGKKVQRKKYQLNNDFSLFLSNSKETKTKISPQLSFAIYQFLSTSVSGFSEDRISKSVLHKIIQFPGVIQEKEVNYNNEKVLVYLYEKEKPCDYFTLILEGRVEVTIGVEQITFESGPFSIFGQAALCEDETSDHFIPDYSVRVINNVQFFKISRKLYNSCRTATKMEQENKLNNTLPNYDEIFNVPATVIKNNAVKEEKENVEQLSNYRESNLKT
ncbi:metal transporter CNNM4 [Hydra vulgaris]|uniref:metal transporter CNNM4 n=1 Tax=Hydra vulgaris TaxID=6087 RepID=UPI001F5FD9EC|nr:metal transporter CNNM4-like [Hydra vulgaris]